MALRKGSWFGLPEFGLTEKVGSLLGAPRTAQGGSNIFGNTLKQASTGGQVQGASTQPYTVEGAPSGYTAPSSGGTYTSGGSGTPTPSTSGQPSDGGGDAGYDYVGALRSAFDQSRSALQGILPTYDSDFSNFKSTVEGGVNRAKDTLTTQNAEDERLYGQSLKSLLQSDQELRQRRQGVFSSLNALDSSSFRDDVTKADQSLLENQQGLEGEKRRTFDARQREYAAYEQEANSKIASYANEIQRAKQALQQAIASVNMDEASSIQNYIGQLQQQAQQVNSQREALALNLTQLQAQGTDVVGNLGRMNLQGFSNIFGQNLANRVKDVTARYTLPQQQVAGSGYINPKSGKAYTDDERRLLGI
jgi:hypothetical protein